MSNMSYCRHENTARDLEEVWEQWEDYEEGTSEYEDSARKRIVYLVEQMFWDFVYEGLIEDPEGK